MIQREIQITKKTTFMSFLIDETGSMQDIKDDTIGGVNSYVEVLQKSNGDIVLVRYSRQGAVRA